MNWTKFVKGEEVVAHEKSHNYYLEKIMSELLDNNTLSSWVRETNERISQHM